MSIEKKLIYCQTKDQFNAKNIAGDFLNSSIVYIGDTGEIWTHGKTFGGFFTNIDSNRVSLTIGGIEKNVALEGHTHKFEDIRNIVVASNEFNFIPEGWASASRSVFINYLPIKDRIALTNPISMYEFGNGATGHANVRATGFIKTGSSNLYALLGAGGHQLIDSNATSSSIVARDSSGHIRAKMVETSIVDEALSIGSVYVRNTSDNFIRRMGWDTFMNAVNTKHTHGLLFSDITSTQSIINASSFRTNVFGTSSSGFGFKVLKWTEVPSILSGLSKFGSGLFWGGADANGFLALNFNSAMAKIGGGNGNNITWTANLWHTGNLIGVQDAHMHRYIQDFIDGRDIYLVASQTATSSYTDLAGWDGYSLRRVRANFAPSSHTHEYVSESGVAASLGRGGNNTYRMYFNWEMRSGQPVGVWGGDNWSDMYIYNPSNFRVAYAEIAGSTDKVGGLYVHSGKNNESNKIVRTDGNGHLNVGYISAGGDEKNNSNPPYIWGTNGTDSYLRTYSTSALRVAYAETCGSSGIPSEASELSSHLESPTACYPTYGARVFNSTNFGNTTSTSSGYAVGISIGDSVRAGYGFQLVQNRNDSSLYTRKYAQGWATRWDEIYTSNNANNATSSWTCSVLQTTGIMLNGNSSGLVQTLGMSGNYIQLGNPSTQTTIPIDSTLNLRQSGSLAVSFGKTMSTFYTPTLFNGVVTANDISVTKLVSGAFRQQGSATSGGYPRVPVVILVGTINTSSVSASWHFNPLNLSVSLSREFTESVLVTINDQKGLTFYLSGDGGSSSNTTIIFSGFTHNNPNSLGYVTYMRSSTNSFRIRMSDDASMNPGTVNLTFLYYGAHNW